MLTAANNATIAAGVRAGHPLEEVLDARNWRAQLANYSAVMGFRAELSHVSPATWAARYAANEDAFSAAIEELPRD